jgi:hypothetical protein
MRQDHEWVAAPAIIHNVSPCGALLETLVPCRVGSLAYLSIPNTAPVLVRIARIEGQPPRQWAGVAALHMPIYLPAQPPSPVPRTSSLDLPWPCSVNDIRREYRKSAKKLHPDVGGSHAEFVELSKEVHRILHLLQRT